MHTKREYEWVRVKRGHHICSCVEEPLITAPHGHSAWPLKCFEVHHPMKRAQLIHLLIKCAHELMSEVALTPFGRLKPFKRNCALVKKMKNCKVWTKMESSCVQKNVALSAAQLATSTDTDKSSLCFHFLFQDDPMLKNTHTHTRTQHVVIPAETLGYS